MSKHTPGETFGPWTIDYSPDATNERAITGMYQIITTREAIVAETMSEQYAQLIAAAPDLLSALEGACEECRHNPKVYGSQTTECLKGELCEINQALKKARGEGCSLATYSIE